MVERARLKAIFAELLDVRAPERDEFLARLCDGDDELRAEVERLLAADAQTSSAVDSPLIARGSLGQRLQASDEDASASAAAEPVHVGDGDRPYRILRKIADGGMGSVFEAEQSAPRRRVAIKLIRQDAFSVGRERRLIQEAELLGRLQHRSIARVLEAGTAKVSFADGSVASRAFLAMEFVDGVRLTEYAAALDRPARLGVLIDVADAVQHAHQNGVIHRDLKPSNILVDRDGCPKVLDFGIARSEASEPGRSFDLTMPGQVLGTLAYMSPEQIEGASVDTRADVYALGVLAFEVVSGKLPLDVGSQSIARAARTIVERTPPSLGRADPGSKGDLSIVVDKALAKSPEDRYQSAAEFADELRRVLEKRPIHARPPSPIYRAGRFVQRNPVLVGASTALVVVLVAATIVSLNLAVASKRDALRARAVANFVQDMIKGIRPELAQEMDTALLRHILSRTVDRLDSGELASEPQVEAEMRVLMGRSFDRLGDRDVPIDQYRRAISLYTLSLGAGAHLTLETGYDLANALIARGREEDVEEASRLLKRLDVDLRRSRDGDGMNLVVGAAKKSLGLHLTRLGRHEEAIEQLEAAVADYTASFGEDHQVTFSARHVLAGALQNGEQFERSLEQYDLVREALVEKVGPEHAFLDIVDNARAEVLAHLGRLDDAIELAERVVARQRAILPENHPDLSDCCGVLGELLIERDTPDDLPRAASLVTESLRIEVARLEPDHPDLLEHEQWAVRLLEEAGEFGSAVEVLEAGFARLSSDGPASAEQRRTASAIIELCDRWAAADTDSSIEAASRASEWRQRLGRLERLGS